MNQIHPSVSYEDWLIERLQDPDEAEVYLNAMLESFNEDQDIDTLRFALKHVYRAHVHPDSPSLPQTEEEYDAILSALADMLNEGSVRFLQKEVEQMLNLVTSHENKHHPTDFPDAISAIKFHMNQTGLSIDDIAPCIGSAYKAREVLKGRRDLTLSMKRALCEHFTIRSDFLLGEPGKNFNPDVDTDKLEYYPWKEIKAREWVKPWVDWKDRFEEMFGELSRSVQNRLAPSPSTYLRKSGGYDPESNSDHYAVQAWCMRIANVANDNPATGAYLPQSVTRDFMREVAALSVHHDGPLRAQKFLSENGINLVTERHLPKTYLDGAALRLSNGMPVIGLTVRFDRLDNFWFTLMHELAHVSLHLNDDIDNMFFDQNIFSRSDLNPIENEADDFATTSLIPPDVWESDLDVNQMAKLANVHPAIVVGRIRYENHSYATLSEFVGQGEVRSMFGLA